MRLAHRNLAFIAFQRFREGGQERPECDVGATNMLRRLTAREIGAASNKVQADGKDVWLRLHHDAEQPGQAGGAGGDDDSGPFPCGTAAC